MNILLVNCSPVQNGATAEIVAIARACLGGAHDVRSVCIDDYGIGFCKGCRSCHATAECVQKDDVPRLVAQYGWADAVLSVSPSYWADVPGQFKAFIDRCTPWCNTHEPHASIGGGKRGYAIALRTGPSMGECRRIIETIEHFYGHLEIQPRGSLGLCSIDRKEDLAGREDEIKEFCSTILRENGLCSFLSAPGGLSGTRRERTGAEQPAAE